MREDAVLLDANCCFANASADAEEADAAFGDGVPEQSEPKLRFEMLLTPDIADLRGTLFTRQAWAHELLASNRAKQMLS